MKIKPPADVMDFERNELCWCNSKSGLNYAKAKLIIKGGCIISIARTGTLPSGEIQDGLEDVDIVWDIDRWENDGGRSLGMSSRT